MCDAKMMAASEIKTDAFVYRDVLLVHMGDAKRHSRASASELEELLLLKDSVATQKDQVATLVPGSNDSLWLGQY